MLGIFGSAAVYVTASSADLWVGYPGTQSVNFGRRVRPTSRCACAWTRPSPAVEPYLWVEGRLARHRCAPRRRAGLRVRHPHARPTP